MNELGIYYLKWNIYSNKINLLITKSVVYNRWIGKFKKKFLIKEFCSYTLVIYPYGIDRASEVDT